MSIRAKILVEKKFWIILDNGIKKGTLRFINDNAYEYISNGDSDLLTEESLYRTFGKDIFKEIKTAVATSDKEDCYEYPTDFEVIYNKEKAPSIDRAFLQRNMVLFSSRGREIRTPDLLLPKQAR